MARSFRKSTPSPVVTTVYILKFSAPLGNLDNVHGFANTYVGYTASDNVWPRIEQHRTGKGAHITAAAVANGITLEVVALFRGGRELERQIKNRKNTPKLIADLQAGKTVKGLPAPFYVAPNWD